MLKIYTHDDPCFGTWVAKADSLYRAEFVEKSGRKADFDLYQPMEFDRLEGAHYLLYLDEQEKACGSAILLPLRLVPKASDHLADQNFNPNTWCLRDVHFFLHNGHPALQDSFEAEYLRRDFHKSVLDQLLEVSRAHSCPLAVVLNRSSEALTELQVARQFYFDQGLLQPGCGWVWGVTSTAPHVDYRAHQQGPLLPLLATECPAPAFQYEGDCADVA